MTTSLLITISRSTDAGGPSPLILSGTLDENDIGITNFTEPSLRARITYGPDSRYFDGSEETAVAWEQDQVAFGWTPSRPSTEAAVQVSYLELAAALAQRRFDVTTQISDAPALVWRAKRGSMIPRPRELVDLLFKTPVYDVTIPVFPIPSGA